MSAKLKVKRGTTASWADSTNKDTTLEPGQIGVEYLTDGSTRMKVGSNNTTIVDLSEGTSGGGFEFTIVEGATYYVDEHELDQTGNNVIATKVYKGVRTSDSHYVYIGNISLKDSNFPNTGEDFCIWSTVGGSGSYMSLNSSSIPYFVLKGTSVDWKKLPYVAPPTSVYQDDSINMGSMKIKYNTDNEALEFIAL